MKKIMLGSSDAWSMSRLSHQPSDPAYYIEDCRISNRELRSYCHNIHTMGFTVYSIYCAGDAFISRLTLLHYILHVVYRVLQVLFYTLRCCT